MPGYWFALGLAAVFGFSVWAVKSMPPFLAWIGIAAGIAMIMLDLFNLRAYAPPVLVAFIGLFLMVGAGWWIYRISSAPKELLSETNQQIAGTVAPSVEQKTSVSGSGNVTTVQNIGTQNNYVAPEPAGPKNFGSLSAPKVLLDTRNNKVGKVFRIGDKGFIQLMSPDKPAFDFGDTFLDVETIDGELKVSTTLKDESGTQIAYMYRNEWKIMPPPKTFDRNYTKDALEIMGADGNIVLQLKLFPDYVFINGQWHTLDGRFIRIVKDKNGGGVISAWAAGQEPKDLPKIQPMFLYPSEQFFGQLR